jgi:hypothetical protein
MMRFADALSGGLLGAITGKDMSQGVIPGLLGKDMSGGIAGMIVGDDYPSLTNIQKTGMSTFGLTPELEKVFGAQKAFGHFGMMGGPTPNA